MALNSYVLLIYGCHFSDLFFKNLVPLSKKTQNQRPALSHLRGQHYKEITSYRETKINSYLVLHKVPNPL